MLAREANNRFYCCTEESGEAVRLLLHCRRRNGGGKDVTDKTKANINDDVVREGRSRCSPPGESSFLGRGLFPPPERGAGTVACVFPQDGEERKDVW